MLLQPQVGEPAQPVGLAPGDGLRRNAVERARAGLDVADDQRAAFAGDDVGLAFGAAPVTREDLQPGLGQVPDRDVLAVTSDGILGAHATTSAATMRCCAVGSVRLPAAVDRGRVWT